jgi:hypothetical protein
MESLQPIKSAHDVKRIDPDPRRPSVTSVFKPGDSPNLDGLTEDEAALVALGYKASLSFIAVLCLRGLELAHLLLCPKRGDNSKLHSLNRTQPPVLCHANLLNSKNSRENFRFGQLSASPLPSWVFCLVLLVLCIMEWDMLDQVAWFGDG